MSQLKSHACAALPGESNTTVEVFAAYGMWGMFFSAFLAATILPLSSELVLGYLLSHGSDASALVAVATFGNVLGALLNYVMGGIGSRFVVEKILRISEGEMEKAIRRFRTHGAMCLLLAWVPVIGDPLTLAAGVLKVDLRVFLILVTIGKCGRYIVLSHALINL